MSESFPEPFDGSHATELLFAYGTFRNEAVQRSTFGRPLDGAGDEIEGFSLTMLERRSSDAAEASDARHHPILVATGQTEDRVEGTVYRVTLDELKHADEHGGDEYRREKVKLVSGKIAWAYVDAEPSGFAPDGTM
jgi:gamma-glutamylcyclotransferase (GGCT)/AIG2-like uncharacterized protein YtfP